MQSTTELTDGALCILAFSTSNETLQTIVSQLRNQLPKSAQFDVAGKRGADIVMSGLTRIKRRKTKKSLNIKDSMYSGGELHWVNSKALSEAVLMGLDHLQRRTENFAWSHNNLNTFYDAVQYYHLVVDIMADHMVRNHINVVLFFDIPHLYYDTIAYHIAKAKRIQTIILTFSPFINRFFSLRDLDQFGRLREHSDQPPVAPLTIDKNLTIEWGYMSSVKQYQGQLGSLDGRGIIALFCHLLTSTPVKLFNPRYLVNCINRMRHIASTLPKWRYPFAKFFHIRHLAYFETLLDFEKSEIDWHCKFVYFPLHLQPELSTSTIGGDYYDQLLAIEKLAEIIPADCLIFVKENPKQTGAMRGAQFFNRLFRIRQVRLVPSYANTQELLDHSQFVATVTGTVGWEAICKGKAVLFFGNPWYRDLDGAIPFRYGMTYDEIISSEINHAELEQKAGLLLSRTHEGALYIAKQKDQDHAIALVANAKTVARTILDLIEHKVEPTFLNNEG